MLAKAEQKKIYDHLIVDDLISALENQNETYDLFLSSDAFVYIGDLKNVFRSVKKNARQKAYFIFSTEHEEGKGYSLLKTGRYSHSKSYIQHLSNEFGFTFASFEKCNLRKNKGSFLIGGLYILQI